MLPNGKAELVASETAVHKTMVRKTFCASNHIQIVLEDFYNLQLNNNMFRVHYQNYFVAIYKVNTVDTKETILLK